MIETESEQVAFEWFAGAHPHEAYAKDPERFWAFFQTQCPGVSRDAMIRFLEETNTEPTTTNQ